MKRLKALVNTMPWHFKQHRRLSLSLVKLLVPMGMYRGFFYLEDFGLSGMGVYYPDGRNTQRIGLVPDVEVHSSIKSIREGRDALLEKAVEIINKN